MLTLDLNSKTGQLSQYKKFDFNSMVRFGDKYIGFNENGISTIGGKKDNGSNIDASIEFATVPIAGENPARIHRSYMSYQSDGEMELSYIFDDDPRTAHAKTYPKVSGRDSIGRSGKRSSSGSHLMVKVNNVDGSDFVLHAIDLEVIVLHPARKRAKRTK